MSFTINFKIETIFLAIYLVCFLFFNITTYLISDFYRKKFDTPLINRGFLASIVFLTIAIPLLFIDKSRVIAQLRLILLLTTALLSSWNSILLYITMRRVRK